MSSYLKLDTIIESKLDDLDFMDLNNEERERLVDEIVKLEKLKLEVEAAEYERKRREESDIREKHRYKMDKIDKIIDYIFRTLGIFVPLTFYTYVTNKAYDFERDATLSYQISRDNRRNALNYLSKHV